jgi:hypothetical protein
MALVNPNIAMSFRQPEIQAPNALAQYAQLQQIQGGQQAQELARFQLGAAQRAENVQNALADAYSSSIDSTGNIDYNKLIGSLSKGGGASQIPSVLKTQAETKAAQLAQQKTQGEIDKNQFELQDKKLKFAWNAVGSATTPEAAIAEVTKGVKDGVFDMKSATAEIQQLQSMTPEQYQQYRVQKVMGIMEAKDKLGFMLPKTRDRDTGGIIQVIQDNPALPGYGLPMQGVAPIKKTPTIGEMTAQGQLSLAQQKFAFEKANPGYELKEGDDGTIYGVNKRTLQAMPVMMGGTAPAAAPAAPAAGGPRVPQAGVGQAIPGMPSVLDQPVVAAPVAGAQPLKGKGTPLNEGQGNATAFGMRMAESHKLLSELEKAGTTSGGRIKGAVQGTLSSLVPYQGERLAEGAGAVMNVMPGFLGGPNENQQAYMQGKENFITAVLRKESGAAIGADEYSREDRKYFPQAGDSEKVIKQKQRARELAIDAMKIQAGPGAKNIGGAGALPSANANIPGASANNPLGLPGL